MSGQYVHNSYIDRSIGSLGDDQVVKKEEIKINNNDIETVKTNISHIKEVTSPKSEERFVY